MSPVNSTVRLLSRAPAHDLLGTAMSRLVDQRRGREAAEALMLKVRKDPDVRRWLEGVARSSLSSDRQGAVAHALLTEVMRRETEANRAPTVHVADSNASSLSVAKTPKPASPHPVESGTSVSVPVGGKTAMVNSIQALALLILAKEGKDVELKATEIISRFLHEGTAPDRSITAQLAKALRILADEEFLDCQRSTTQNNSFVYWINPSGDELFRNLHASGELEVLLGHQRRRFTRIHGDLPDWTAIISQI